MLILIIQFQNCVNVLVFIFRGIAIWRCHLNFQFVSKENRSYNFSKKNKSTCNFTITIKLYLIWNYFRSRKSSRHHHPGAVDSVIPKKKPSVRAEKGMNNFRYNLHSNNNKLSNLLYPGNWVVKLWLVKLICIIQPNPVRLSMLSFLTFRDYIENSAKDFKKLIYFKFFWTK